MISTEALIIVGEKLARHGRAALEANASVDYAISDTFIVTAGPNIFEVSIQQRPVTLVGVDDGKPT